MKSGVTLVRDNSPGLRRAVAALTKTACLVGFPASEAERDPEPGEPHQPMTNAALGYIHDKGSPAANIPARPFMEPGIAAAQDKIAATYSKAAKSVLDQPASADTIIDAAHNRVGLTAQDAIQSKIEAGVPPPLAARTIADRRRRFGADASETPLIDSGQMKAAVTYVLRPKGKS